MSEPRDPEAHVGAEGADDELRRMLQRLPEVAPPDGFYERLIRRRRRRARLVAGVGLAAAGVLGAVLVGQASGITGDVAPPMSVLAERHDDLAVTEVAARDDMGDVPAPYQAPERLGGMSRGFALRHPDDVVQVVYGDDGHYVSVFEQAGDLTEGDMDAELTRLDVPGVEAWQADDGAVVVRRDDVVYVLYGELDAEDLTEVVDQLPDARPMGLARRVRDAMDDLVDAFGFG